jgi:hypothetical protein
MSEESWFDSPQEQQGFHFSKASRLVLEPNQPAIQFYQWTFLGIMAAGL